MRISDNNNISYKGDFSKLIKPLEVFYDKNSVLPTLLIETGVTLGRTYEAAKTGGKKEAVERFVEQGVSAVVWLWGVQTFRTIGENIAKLFKKDLSDNFKAGNTLASLALATGFIGFVLPKINHFISKKVMEKSNKKEAKKPETLLKTKSFDEFSKKNKNISFTSLVSVANAFENNNALRLFVTDTGVIAGRYKNGRNKYEKIEGLFRDISSIYFYLAFTKHFVKGMNKLTKNPDVRPEILKRQYNILKENNLDTTFFLKEANKSIHKNFAFYALGTALSAVALGIGIPKVQYLLRHKLTNKNQFPGDDNYKVEK